MSVYEGCSEDFLYLFFSFLFRYIILVHWSFDHLVIANLVLILSYIYMMWLLLHLFHLSFHVLFLFSLNAHASYLLYAIFYFCFTLRCIDEFCLKCFRNIGCQSLLAINSLLAKFFKSLCWDRFYCIQQVSIS